MGIEFYGELNDFEVDLTAFKRTIKAIGDNYGEDVLILIETTVLWEHQKLAYQLSKNV